MIIKNTKLRGREGLWQISIYEGIITRIARTVEQKPSDNDVIDGGGRLVLPPFIEPHVHLDTTLTAGDPKWNLSGTLFEGIQRWSERKPYLTREDVIDRATTVLKWQASQGIQQVRSHVDITDPRLIGLQAMLEVKERVRSWMDLQIVAFPQEGVISYPNGADLLEEALRMGADAVGGIPHFEFTQEYGVESIKKVFELAVKYDRLVDIHCDEIDDEQSRFIEVVAAEAYRLGLGKRVTASHTTAMHSYNGAYTSKLFRLLQLSEINFIANPLVNTHLQGRFDSYPKRRGITRVKELLEAGINVCFGHDDICDPWYPLGTGSMLQVLLLGLHVSHLMGYEEIMKGMDLITVNSAIALNSVDRYGIEEGKPANLIVLDAKDEYDAIRLQSPVHYSIREGRIIAKTEVPETTLHLNGGSERFSFER